MFCCVHVYVLAVLRDPLLAHVACVPQTGVKYVHHKAMRFDIGVYFEVG